MKTFTRSSVCFIALIFLYINTIAQHSCCSLTATSEFAMLSNNPTFTSSHAAPLPYNFVAEKGKMITVKVPGGKEASVFEVKADKPTNNYLFVFHEWWGLN